MSSLVLVLHNIRSTYNVGAILRTAEGLGVKNVICSGYTPWYQKPGLLPHLSAKLKRQIAKSALGAEEMLTVEYTDDIIAKLHSLKATGFQVVGLENNLSRETILLNSPDLQEKLGDHIALVLGEEVSGIPEDVRAEVDLFLEIPMRGQKESFNVSVAAAIALYVLTS